MERAKKGDWVQVKQIVLPPDGRAPQAPEDTKATPLLLWVKGFAKSEGAIGEEISVETLTGREVKGELSAINPRYVHDFGDFVPEFLVIDVQLRSLMEEV